MSEDVQTPAPPPRDEADALARLRDLVMADAALQLELSRPYDPAVFAELAAQRAAERGIAVSAAAIRAQARPDPLGISRWLASPGIAQGWPGRDWLPIHIDAAGEPYVDWAHFAGARLTEPFFEMSARRAAVVPFNAMFRWRTSLRGFLDAARRAEARKPQGLIFHMSRCGSTLVAQMLAAVARNTVLSEAGPLDTAVQLEGAYPDRCEGLIAAVVSALGRRRFDGDESLFLKLDSWHAAALPLFRRVFPDTPWVFLYRDPLEVMVSQAAVRGVQTIPGVLPPHILGVDPAAVSLDEYGAMALARTCEAAAAAHGDGGGLLVNYDELPDAVWTRILPHFGVAETEADRVAMSAAAGFNAKAPTEAFKPDGEAKRRAASPELTGIVERYMAPAFARLEALRTSQA